MQLNKNDLNKITSTKTLAGSIKLQEFYINDNIKNIPYNHPSNYIRTTKYNFITFLPKSFLFQFSRLPNVYFLFSAIIQCIPTISPLNPVTAIVPLVCVLCVSIFRELIEDIQRYNYDKLNNEEKVIVLREGKFVESVAGSLRVGEIVLVKEDCVIPSDMAMIDSFLSDGQCYVETSSLDGEKSLKEKIAPKAINGVFSDTIKIDLSLKIKQRMKFSMTQKYF